MKKLIILLLAFTMLFSLCACGSGNDISGNGSTTPAISPEETASFTESTPELEPNLQRLQGSWASSENYEEDEPSFVCSMPATWDKNMKGYYVVTINGTQLVYKAFHKKGNNGRPGGNYDGNVYEKIYEINKVTEKNSDEYQTEFTVDVIADEETQQFNFVLYDNQEKYKNKFMRNDFVDFMFIKLDKQQYASLMDICADIKYNNAMNKELEPYIGMPKAQLKNSTWGEPTDINITETENHTSEQWCYSNEKYVYVDDGYVSAIQK